MRKRVGLFAMIICLAMVAPVLAANLAFHGDMNNRFMLYTNHNDFLVADQKGTLHDGTVNDSFAEIKYRYWFEAESDDNAVKGVFATEIGGLRFGEKDNLTYSGDKIKMEVRWAYLDFQIPNIDSDGRIRMGLQPINVNYYLWNETVAGVNFYSDCDTIDYQFAWMRGYEVNVTQEDDDSNDVDAFLARVNVKPEEKVKAGFFGLYQTSDADASNAAEYGSIASSSYQVKMWNDDVDLGLVTLGADGNYGFGDMFVKWDLMYQTGSIDGVNFLDSASGEGYSGDFDVNAYFLHMDLGLNAGEHKFTYTFWYASGDDDAEDDDFDAFVSTDVDIFDSICLMEGGYADDDYFTERDYILDKGFMMNKIGWDFKASEKTTVGAALMYMMTAEDIEYYENDGDEAEDDSLGIELDAYYKYMLYKNVEFAINAGYLWADDALDAFEASDIKDGSADEDIFVSSARVRYNF